MNKFSIIIILLFVLCNVIYGKDEPSEESLILDSTTLLTKTFHNLDENLVQEAVKKGVTLNKESAVSTFISAGINYGLGKRYNLTISPIDNTVQFEKISPMSTGLSTGLVWQPFYINTQYMTYAGEELIDNRIERTRSPFAFALLVNILKITVGEDISKSTSPIDVGFGFGYKVNDLLALLTFEFSAIRQPRDYIVNNYKDQNLPLVLANSSEPLRNISVDDNSLFISEVCFSIGLKVAYSFDI